MGFLVVRISTPFWRQSHETDLSPPGRNGQCRLGRCLSGRGFRRARGRAESRESREERRGSRGLPACARGWGEPRAGNSRGSALRQNETVRTWHTSSSTLSGSGPARRRPAEPHRSSSFEEWAGGGSRPLLGTGARDRTGERDRQAVARENEKGGAAVVGCAGRRCHPSGSRGRTHRCGRGDVSRRPAGGDLSEASRRTARDFPHGDRRI